MTNNDACPVCGSLNAKVESLQNIAAYDYVQCASCGTFAVPDFDSGLYPEDLDRNYLAAYLFYNGSNGLLDKENKFRYFIGAKKPFEDPIWKLVTCDEINAWYPKSFSEKLDTILLALAKLSKYNGSEILLSIEENNSLFFVQRFTDTGASYSNDDQFRQCYFFLNYMEKQNFLFSGTKNTQTGKIAIHLLPKALQRVDELQKNQVNSKKVFVAMGYSDKSKQPRTLVREAIRKAINKAGFEADFLDEHEHNNQIVPEMLYRIRQSRFIIADLTYCNNGAYYEAGYAAGLGKEVIHLCQSDDFHETGHFDVKQKATILWQTEADIEEKLFKRIQATIS